MGTQKPDFYENTLLASGDCVKNPVSLAEWVSHSRDFFRLLICGLANF
ncbi:hypothetical protein MicvaDRAFT_3642 [Microcoleus vaginatus FGP-2]|nr:hypothetical protein MicvaDRAFT_3642 [Microcoleus vaginatus FGP-2]